MELPVQRAGKISNSVALPGRSAGSVDLQRWVKFRLSEPIRCGVEDVIKMNSRQPERVVFMKERCVLQFSV
jgi:hypothetical protein